PRARRVELQVGAADFFEATQLDQKFIAAGRQIGKCVEATTVGDGGVGLLRLRARHRDGCARDDATLRVLDRTRNRGSIELGECRRPRAYDHEKGQGGAKKLSVPATLSAHESPPPECQTRMPLSALQACSHPRGRKRAV